jgi:hypothetical protein
MNKLYLESVVDMVNEKDNQVYLSKRIDIEIPFSQNIDQIKTHADIFKIIYEYLLTKAK